MADADASASANVAPPADADAAAFFTQDAALPVEAEEPDVLTSFHLFAYIC